MSDINAKGLSGTMLGGGSAYYNSGRPHSAIRYLTPDDVFYGGMEKRLAERKEKLHTAFIKRQEYWRGRDIADTPYKTA